MQNSFYFLSPVEVVKVTSQNLEEVAEWCGGSVQETESRRVPGRMDKYVLVPTPKDSNISWAFPGMFVTKRIVVTVKDELRSTFAVFRRDYFEKNYFDNQKAAVDKTWEREALEKSKPKKPEVKVSNNVGEKLIEAQKLMQEAGVSEEKAKEVVESVAPDMPETPTFVHNHSSKHRCLDNGCNVDRYVDGLHKFTNENIFAKDEVTDTVHLPADASLA